MKNIELDKAKAYALGYYDATVENRSVDHPTRMFSVGYYDGRVHRYECNSPDSDSPNHRFYKMGYKEGLSDVEVFLKKQLHRNKKTNTLKQ